MNKYICVHGHFYQPPRENPWLELIEMQDSAGPFHDWNERITFECYEPNTASRIMENSRIIEIVNNYKKMSFNFGPTLLSWLENHKPDVYKAIQQADRESLEHYNGHGSAIAQAYNHMILPLANSRDKETQVIWGIRDFEKRFGRKPEGMWLPETAVDTDSLEVLAKHEIKFTILAPGQADEFREEDSGEWIKIIGASIDPKVPYICNLPSGRSITLFFYDGPVSHDLAFKGLLENGKVFADRLMGAFDSSSSTSQLVHIATDGESYGHHHKHGDMALSFCMHYIEKQKTAGLTNYANFLSKNPPVHEVMIHENSSWSCAHGVERWRSNCGCKATTDPSITQEWRGPLRSALDWLRGEAEKIYTANVKSFTMDPWHLRNVYINVILDRSEESVNTFFQENISKELSEADKIKLIKLLEMQRHSMLMYTSCGWFFNDIAGIETIQIIQYAARVLQLAEELSSKKLKDKFLTLLEKVKGNSSKLPDAKVLYQTEVEPKVIDLKRVAGHFAVLSLYADQPDESVIGAYQISRIKSKEYVAGRHKISGGLVKIHSLITYEQQEFAFCTLNLGSYNILGGICDVNKLPDFDPAFDAVKKAHAKNNINEIIIQLNKYFGTHEYSFWHIFHDEQRKIINKILSERLSAIEGAYKLLFNTNYSLMQLISNFRLPMPDAFSFTGKFVLNEDIKRLLSEGEVDLQDLENQLNELEKFSLDINEPDTGSYFVRKVVRMMNAFVANVEDVVLLQKLINLLSLIKKHDIQLNLWKVQNLYYNTAKAHYDQFQQKAATGNENAAKWIGLYNELGNLLNIKIA